MVVSYQVGGQALLGGRLHRFIELANIRGIGEIRGRGASSSWTFSVIRVFRGGCLCCLGWEEFSWIGVSGWLVCGREYSVGC